MPPRNVLRTVLFCVPALLAAKHVRTAEPVLSPDPLSAEQTIVYRGFLTGYLRDPTNATKPTLDLAVTTEAFNPSPDIHPDQGCLSAEDIDDLSTPLLHRLSPGVLPSNRIKLIDVTPPSEVQENASTSKHHKQAAEPELPAIKPTNLLTLSEIVFNKEHTLAAFHYSYICGEECGHGETVVYELRGGAWKLAKAGCSKWVI